MFWFFFAAFAATQTVQAQGDTITVNVATAKPATLHCALVNGGCPVEGAVMFDEQGTMFVGLTDDDQIVIVQFPNTGGAASALVFLNGTPMGSLRGTFFEACDGDGTSGFVASGPTPLLLTKSCD